MAQPLWRTVWQFLKILKVKLPYDPAIPVLSIYPEKTIILINMRLNVHHSTIHKSQNLELT